MLYHPLFRKLFSIVDLSGERKCLLDRDFEIISYIIKQFCLPLI